MVRRSGGQEGSRLDGQYRLSTFPDERSVKTKVKVKNQVSGSHWRSKA